MTNRPKFGYAVPDGFPDSLTVQVLVIHESGETVAAFYATEHTPFDVCRELAAELVEKLNKTAS